MLGERLKMIRQQRYLTQAQLAKRLNISVQTISNWENNVQKPTLETFKSLILELSCNADYLLGISPISETASSEGKASVLDISHFDKKSQEILIRWFTEINALIEYETREI